MQQIKVGQHFITAEGQVVEAVQDNGSQPYVSACKGCLFNESNKISSTAYCGITEKLPSNSLSCVNTIFVGVTDAE
jgi:hypothetical protein